ncbi:Hypothetical protein F387_00490 [Wohlfahrtiimonas chitiniclastica SH04]|uniref:Uncharacterized protein n=1 Tax=Wohlfahrtiimonas chitiniclastica SH04 TaxID=1261130 RepID=L8XWG0_9GAMM|nr:Hypothetical protein F387_00490 [Wohlfahrtiimonas chitiniclastica SH04]
MNKTQPLTPFIKTHAKLLLKVARERALGAKDFVRPLF